MFEVYTYMHKLFWAPVPVIAVTTRVNHKSNHLLAARWGCCTVIGTELTLWKVLARQGKAPGLVPVGYTVRTSSPVLADKAPHITRIFLPLLEDYLQSFWKSHKLAGYYTQTFHSIQRYYHRDYFKQSRKLLSSRGVVSGFCGFFVCFFVLFSVLFWFFLSRYLKSLY